MKVKVNENCIGCGNCVMMTEEKVFSFNDDGMTEAIVEEVPEDMTKTVKEAIDACPVEAIEEVPEDMTKTVKEAIDACPVEAIEEKE